MATNKKTPAGAEVSDKQIIAHENKIVNFNAENLISQAITQKLPVDTMERLLAMRKDLKAEWAKEQFDAAMAAFQAACPTIEKTKRVSFGTTNYSYAPLEVIVEQVRDILAANGFSYTFDTEESPQGLTIFCMVKHIAGHMEKSKCLIAIDSNSKMNISQKSGAAMTYGKRYAFVNAFGILTGDEDNDAVEPQVKRTPRSEELPVVQVEMPIKPTTVRKNHPQFHAFKKMIESADTIEKLNNVGKMIGNDNVLNAAELKELRIDWKGQEDLLNAKKNIDEIFNS